MKEVLCPVYFGTQPSTVRCAFPAEHPVGPGPGPSHAGFDAEGRLITFGEAREIDV